MRFYLILVLLLLPYSSKAQEVAETQTNPLAPFEFLVGGTWSSTTTLQTFEWGVGNQSVISNLYFTDADSAKLVGEITWFWHPGKQEIKGYGTSIEMAMNFFDYTTFFDSPKVMRNEFFGYGGSVDNLKQYETLEFINDDQYLWTYYNLVAGELKPAYSLTFSRLSGN